MCDVNAVKLRLYNLGMNNFTNHEPIDESLKYAVPELVAGQTLANANAHGSDKARKKARIMVWILIAAFILPIVFGLILTATQTI